MPKPVSHSHQDICDNYPLCTKQKHRPIDKETKRRKQKCFCTTCLALRTCPQPFCDDKVICAHPGTFCLKHTDPSSIKNASGEAWPTCKHLLKHNCKHLLPNPTSSELCYACNAGHLPCNNSLHGCWTHVRENKHGTLTCDTRSKKCDFSAKPCVMNCGRYEHKHNSGQCVKCRPLKSNIRINGKRPLAELSFTTRKPTNSNICVFAPLCNERRSDVDSQGRCDTCAMFSEPPCKHSPFCNQRAPVFKTACKTCLKSMVLLDLDTMVNIAHIVNEHKSSSKDSANDASALIARGS